VSSPCRILAFRPARAVKVLSREEYSEIAESYLDSELDARDPEVVLDPDVLLAVSAGLRERVEIEPAKVFDESVRLFGLVSSSDRSVGFFDEKDYLLGEFSFIAAKSGRHIGKTEDSERWLDRAESFFRLVVNSAPHLASTAYLRLALKYENRKFDDVLEHAPALAKTFDRLGMPSDAMKTRFLEAVTLKVVGRRTEAFNLASNIVAAEAGGAQPALLGQAWSEIGEYHASGRDFPAATQAFGRAISFLQNANRPVALMSLKLSLGEMFRVQVQLEKAHEAFRSAGEDARKLGMPTYVAYAHVLAGETLLALERPREAEWEIYAALPILDSHKMVPEALAAVAVLRESVAARKTDAGALKVIREYLQSNA